MEYKCDTCLGCNRLLNDDFIGTYRCENYEKENRIMDKERLKKIFEEAERKTIDVVLELTVPGRLDSEFIIVMSGNLGYKLNYYMENYNDNLELIRCPEVKIIGAKVIDTDNIPEFNGLGGV